MYIFLLILYCLSVLPLTKSHQLVLIQSLSKLLWSGQKLIDHRQVCCQCPQNRVPEMPDLESHRLAERLAYLGQSTVIRLKMRDAFPRLEFNPKAKGHLQPKGNAPFASECCKPLRNLPGSSDLSRSQKKLYLELVVGSTLDLLMEWLGWSLEEVRSQ